VAGALRIGCSGWNYRSWRGVLYPDGLPQRRWLERYAEVFDTVEVNASFYRLVRETTAAAWAAQTPPGFLFAVKASRYLTHVRRLRDLEEGVARFWAPLAPLRAAGKLGPVLWQLPPDFRRDDARLRALLAALPSGARHAIEFREPSWFCDEVYALLADHAVCLVWGDDPRLPFAERVHTAPFTFARLHHGARGRRGNYAESELRAWAERLLAARERGDVFAFWNNDWEGFAVRNARQVLALTERQPPGALSPRPRRARRGASRPARTPRPSAPRP
jgi:uncharacterized protein YecE (DUF72 family)